MGEKETIFKVELNFRDMLRVQGSLMREAMEQKDAADYYDKGGYDGIASSHRAEGYALMKTREKFRGLVDTA